MLDGSYKVAQYGQWDGYPEGVGAGVLRFLREQMNREKFIENLQKCVDFTPEMSSDIERSSVETGVPWRKSHPWLSRDVAEEVLLMIQSSDGGLALKRDINFAGESLMCEYAYVIDFDKNTFEAFEGFNKVPLTKDERFAGLPVSDREFDGYGGEKPYRYYQVKLVKSWPLDNLPTEDELIKAFAKSEDEEGHGLGEAA
ncbi:hypothetical protein CFBP5875_04595 [Agrobacterium pusense]|nr:hypothetical protein CFBP5875_04595 [Agrobacterium pusense]